MTTHERSMSPSAARFAVVVAVLCAASWACAGPSQAGADAVNVPKAAAGDQSAAAVIDHLSPRRDSVGERPAKFAWTAAPGADHYAIGLWDEVDRLRWRQDDVTGTSIDMPAGLELEAGTYFWSVSALRDGREVAQSGLAAFVLER